MDFIEYINNWAKSEVTQGRIMIGAGLLAIFVFYSIYHSQNELLKGTLIPLGFILVGLVGYGSFILYSRPVHAKQSIALYQESKSKAIEEEKTKHINENKTGKILMNYVYPVIILLSAIVLLLLSSQYYKGMAVGLILLAVSAYIIDYGFVSRSESFVTFLNSLH